MFVMVNQKKKIHQLIQKIFKSGCTLILNFKLFPRLSNNCETSRARKVGKFLAARDDLKHETALNT